MCYTCVVEEGRQSGLRRDFIKLFARKWTERYFESVLDAANANELQVKGHQMVYYNGRDVAAKVTTDKKHVQKVVWTEIYVMQSREISRNSNM